MFEAWYNTVPLIPIGSVQTQRRLPPLSHGHRLAVENEDMEEKYVWSNSMVCLVLVNGSFKDGECL
jgi:hypothetical protein